MEKIKELLKSKDFYIVLGIIVVIILVIIFIPKTGKTNEPGKTDKKETYQEKLERQLKEMGEDFWELYFYDKISQDETKRKEWLEKYKSIGIKIDLDNLGRYNSEENKEIVEGFVSEKTKEPCNITETKVIIYPVEPYGKNDYQIETVLVCEEKEEDKKDEENNKTEENSANEVKNENDKK